MYKVIKDIKHDTWLAERGKGIGSSEIGTILGLNPFQSSYQLWRVKKGIDRPQQENFAMKAGHYLEDAVARFFSDESGREVIKASAGDWLAVDVDKPFLRVSPDRTYWLDGKRSNDNKGIVECKTTQRQVDANDLPKHWFCQLQYQLGVMQLPEGSLAWLTQGREFGYQTMKLDADFYGWLAEEAEKWWTDYIVGNAEPPVTRVEDILLRSPRSLAGASVQATEDAVKACAELKQLKEQLALLDEQKKTLEERIKLSMGEAEVLLSGGETLATWKSAKDGTKFDERKFKSDHPDIWQEYCTPTLGSRRFLLK